MSSESLPINPAAFAEAIKELSLPILYAKVAELRNSISHLQRSNQELRAFISESCESETDKRELEGYIAENEGVEESMNERIQLCKAEVEGRGQRWIDLDEIANDEAKAGGAQAREQPTESESTTDSVNGHGTPTAPTGESIDRDDDDDDGGAGGVYL
ncbi:uncharacterized protein BJX67DRAFT_377024 [Aspergillus lucknowensis]|uniref:Uncharacterized protein n=1 Tax=Aspergillus lucknowensis TaxID=176173 RepID=A0ABR4M6G2_9EURO